MNRRTLTKSFKCLFTLASIFFLSIGLQAQNVSGKVLDEDGESLIGATVMVKGTTKGATTDANGTFSIAASKDDILEISFLGYRPLEVVVGDEDYIEVMISSDAELLDQFLVTGYGRQKKSEVTGAISSIDVDEITSLSAGQVQSAIQGRTAGVSVLPTSGAPGAGFKVRVRGTGSNGNSEPLYIVDGMRTKDISFLTSNEIAEFEVLKDAASAAIYGAEGANGVVIITTKSGSANNASVNYSAMFGMQSVQTNLKLMNASQHAQYMEEAGIVGRTQADVAASPYGSNNWLETIFEDSPIMSHALSFSGGNEQTDYFIQGSYFDQDGVIAGDRDRFTRIGVRANINSNVKDWLRVGANVNYSHYNKKGVSEDSEFGGVLGNAILMDPLTPATYTNGYPDFVQSLIDAEQPLLKDGVGNYYGLSEFVNGEIYNPLGGVAIRNGSGTTSDRILATTFAEFRIMNGLSFTTRFGVDNEFGNFHNWSPAYYFTINSQSSTANVEQTQYRNTSNLWENFVNYNRDFGNSSIGLVVGTSIYTRKNNYVTGAGTGLIKENDAFGFLGSVQPGVEYTTSNGGESVQNLLSYFGRVTYDYMDKYFLSLVLRHDGSSLLADGNQWGTFPSVSAGWIVSRENFFPQSSFISFMKLRASWGKNGSLANLYPGAWRSAIGFGNAYPDADGNLQIVAEPTILSNPELTWETSVQTDFGIDLGFFNNRLSLTFDYFNKETQDLLNPGIIPNYVGNNAPTVNLGDISNKGFEFEIGYRSYEGAFKWDVSANFTRIKNEVTRLDPNLDFAPGTGVGVGWTATAFEKGLPAWYFRGYETDGIFQNQAEVDEYLSTTTITGDVVPGDPRVVDVNGDGEITPDDQTFIGSPHPDFLYGVRIGAEYKGFDFAVFLQGTVGNDILLGYNRTDRVTTNKPSFYFEDRWTEGNPSNDWFRANGDNIYAYNSDFMVVDGSYARIKQLQLGYTISPKASNSFLRGARFYVSLEDFFTFTSYQGLDPEAGSFNDNSQGIDRGVYPLPRKLMFGLSASF